MPTALEVMSVASFSLAVPSRSSCESVTQSPGAFARVATSSRQIPKPSFTESWIFSRSQFSVPSCSGVTEISTPPVSDSELETLPKAQFIPRVRVHRKGVSMSRLPEQGQMALRTLLTFQSPILPQHELPGSVRLALGSTFSFYLEHYTRLGAKGDELRSGQRSRDNMLSSNCTLTLIFSLINDGTIPINSLPLTAIIIN